MFRFDSQFEDERLFLYIRDARDCNVETVFSCLMIVIH